MRTFDAATVIERAKSLHGFKLDQQLAELLGVSRTSLASWKRRNSIPAKYLLQIVFGTEHTVDWLVSGEEKEQEEDWELLFGGSYIDPKILWLALCDYHLELQINSEKSEAQKALYEALNDEQLAHLHFFLGKSIARLMAAKGKWEKSGLVKGNDIYKAIATEINLSSFDYPPAPWWEED